MDAAIDDIRAELTRRPIEVVVIGASAGGVETLGALLPSLPRDLPACVITVVHLPHDRPSLLAEIFAPKCAVAVREVTDKEPLRAGTLFFAPPDYHVLLEREGAISLSTDPPVHYSRPSIDVLFESASWACGPSVLGIVLSGANADGAAGLAAIRRRRGLTWAQDPTTAIVPSMPLSAIQRAAPDHVLSVQAMAGVLRSWRKSAPSAPGGQA